MQHVRFAGLAVLFLVGCAPLRPMATSPESVPIRLPDGYGRASIQIRWPERRSIQTIPVEADLAYLSAFDASGSLLATASIRRAGTLGEGAMDLPVGSGRYLEVRLDSDRVQGIALGTSNAFEVRRNQTVQVPVDVAPVALTRFGPINAFSLSGGTTPAPGLGRIWSVALGPDDTLYVPDFSSNAVRAVAPDGQVRVVVGQVTDTASQSQGIAATVASDAVEEGGLASAASLRTPHGVYAAPDGDLFVADTLSTSPSQVRVRYVPATTKERFGAQRDAGHVYTLLSGLGTFGAIGMVLDQDGALLMTQQSRNEIWRLTTAGTASVVIGGGSSTANGTLAASASLAAPWGLAMDPQGNLFFSEYQAGRVRMLCRVPGTYFGVMGAMEAGKVYTVMDGVAVKSQFALSNAPYARQIALDDRSNLLVADNRSNSIYRVDRLTGAVSRLIGGIQTSSTVPLGDGGPLASASLNAPHGVAFDSRHRLYIGDTLNGRVRWLHL